jgi:glycosyltransferase involved in cell wall biosynthesis
VFIPNGVDPMQFRPDAAARQEVRRELGLPPGSLLVGLAARLDPMKDHGTFLAAAGRVARQESSVHFALAGAGVGRGSKSLGAALADPPLAERIHLLGERHDMPRLTAAFDIACSSSCSEAFPNAVAEAMACGAVCVATDAGDTAAILGGTGIVVPPRSSEALTLGLLRAISMSPAERLALGQSARERVIQEYTLARCAREYESLFGRLGQIP